MRDMADTLPGLPDPLVRLDGTPVTSAEEWFGERKPEVLALFERHMYGRTPTDPVPVQVDTLSQGVAFDGKATRQEVRLTFGGRVHTDLLVFLPYADKPVPVFLGLNFRGNLLAEHGAPDNQPWPIEELVQRGYGVATACYEDIDPDVDDFGNGIHPLFYRENQQRPEPGEWGAIGAWAWGLSRAVDWLETQPQVDRERVIVVGHSRLGKAAMWAAAQDARFAMAVSNNSGCGGVALSRRRIGETVEAITRRFPHWFCADFAAYADREETLPIDQHLLVALVAPRPVYIASAEDDAWADPEGEFLGGKYADPVYRLLGTDGLTADEQPKLNEPVLSRIGYHIRPGGHAMTPYDWHRFADFADRHL
jgi:hypothetical protein